MLALSIFSFVYGVVLQSTSTLCVILVIYLAFFWGMYLLHAYRSKNGDLVYKRMLSTNNGIPPRNEIIFKEDGIYAQNLDNVPLFCYNKKSPNLHLCKLSDFAQFILFSF